MGVKHKTRNINVIDHDFGPGRNISIGVEKVDLEKFKHRILCLLLLQTGFSN